jgi:hypothetical protein
MQAPNHLLQNGHNNPVANNNLPQRKRGAAIEVYGFVGWIASFVAYGNYQQYHNIKIICV